MFKSAFIWYYEIRFGYTLFVQFYLQSIIYSFLLMTILLHIQNIIFKIKNVHLTDIWLKSIMLLSYVAFVYSFWISRTICRHHTPPFIRACNRLEKLKQSKSKRKFNVHDNVKSRYISHGEKKWTMHLYYVLRYLSVICDSSTGLFLL